MTVNWCQLADLAKKINQIIVVKTSHQQVQEMLSKSDPNKY